MRASKKHQHVKKNEQINFRVTSDTFSRMQKVAVREQRSVSELARIVLEASLPTIETDSVTDFIRLLTRKAA